MNNITKVLGMTAMVLACTNSYAQQAAPICKTHEVTIGARGGANMTTLFAGSNEINKNYDFGMGYNVGLTGSYAINKNFGIAAEVNFAKISAERKDVQPLMPGSALQTASYQLYANYKKKESFDYIEVPVMIRATTGNKVKLFVNAGPYIGFVSNATVETSGRSQLYKDNAGQVTEGGNTTVYSFDGKQTVTSQLATVYCGLAGGLGAGYKFGPHMISVDARYNIGLTNIRTNASVNGKNNITTIGAAVAYSYTIFK